MRIKEDGTVKLCGTGPGIKEVLKKLKLLLLEPVLTEVNVRFEPRCTSQGGCPVRSIGPEPFQVSGSHW